MLNLQFTIGEVSKILAIPIDTLRYYDKINLLPSRNRDLNKYRYYDLEQFDAIITIRMLRAIDVPIERIRELLIEEDLKAVSELLIRKGKEINRQVKYLKQLSLKLGLLHEQFQRFSDTNRMELVNRPACWVLLTDSIMESGDKRLGNKVQQQVQSVHSHQEWLAFCHIISIVSRDNLMTGHYHTYLNNGILSTVSMEGEGGTFQPLEASYCARKLVVIEKEGYAQLDQHYEKLKAFIHRRGLKIAGHALEVNLYNQYNKHYIEIYIPVEEDEETEMIE